MLLLFYQIRTIMMMTMKILFGLGCLMALVVLNSAQGGASFSAVFQSNCDTICADDATCSSGKCILTQCSESSSCFKYCLNCAGVETCYARGDLCERQANVVVLGSGASSTRISTSIILLLIVFSLFNFLL